MNIFLRSHRDTCRLSRLLSGENPVLCINRILSKGTDSNRKTQASNAYLVKSVPCFKKIGSIPLIPSNDEKEWKPC